MIEEVVEMQKQVQFVHGGSEFFGLLDQLIQSAQKSIHLQTYIFDNDETGTKVANALMEAARRGVTVYVLVDGYASQSLPDEFIDKLQDSGIHFRFFEPIFKSSHFYFGRRLHHKVFVADEEKALVCGLNIANRYNDLPNEKAWLDAGILVQGTVAKELAQMSFDLWHKRKNKKGKSYKKALPSGHVQVVRNDWVMGKQEISTCYRQLFDNAHKSITILCSYFLPGTVLRRKLKQAKQRGLNIKVILTGESDVVVAKYAERYLYRWMLRHGIEVYEYQPSVLHAKYAIADEEVITIGSYNVNDLSALASIELNIEVRDKTFVAPISKEINEMIQNDCCKVSVKEINVLSLRNFMQFLSFYFLRAALTLFTFYFHKR